MNWHIEEIDKIIRERGLKSLSDNSYRYEGLNVLDFVSVKKNNCNRSFKKFHAIRNVWDLINCNNDLKLFTAYLFYFRPYINNPIRESDILNGQFLSTYFQTEADWYYSSFVSCCYEKLYNYWDRIGDALAYYLNIDIKEEQVSFPKVIEILSEDFSIKEMEPFKKLIILPKFRTVS